MGRQVTLEDVAAEARVSKSSVSNVINNHPHVRESMRQRVNEAIEKLGYRPQAIGQNLVSGRTGLVSLAIPKLNNPTSPSWRGSRSPTPTMSGHADRGNTNHLRCREARPPLDGPRRPHDGLILSPYGHRRPATR